jgi:hypothetical protein
MDVTQIRASLQTEHCVHSHLGETLLVLSQQFWRKSCAGDVQ